MGKLFSLKRMGFNMSNSTDKGWEDKFDKEYAMGIGRRWIFTKQEAEDIKSFIQKLLVSQREEILSEIKVSLYQLDWIKILDEAIKSRPNSWYRNGSDTVREWRNAGDEILGAMMRQFIEKGIFIDSLSSNRRSK